jgi:hypothetical protein
VLRTAAVAAAVTPWIALSAAVAAGAADTNVGVACVTTAGCAVAYSGGCALPRAVANAGGADIGIAIGAGCTHIGGVHAATCVNDISGALNCVGRAHTRAAGHRKPIAELAVAPVVRGSTCIDLAKGVRSARARIGRTRVREAAAVAFREVSCCTARTKATGVARIAGAADLACHNTAVTLAGAGVASVAPLRNHAGTLCIEHIAIVAIAGRRTARKRAPLPLRVWIHRAGIRRNVTGITGTGFGIGRLVKPKRDKTLVAADACIPVRSIANTCKSATLGLCARSVLTTTRPVARTNAVLFAGSALFVASQWTGTDCSAAL